MNGVITYLTTDLDLTSRDDLSALADALEAGGVRCRTNGWGTDGLHHANFGTAGQHTEPEPAITTILAVVEALDPRLRSDWVGCSRREFNIGYDCGLEPWGFNQRLSAELLGRLAAAGACLRVTLCPEREERRAEPGEAPDTDRLQAFRNW